MNRVTAKKSPTSAHLQATWNKQFFHRSFFKKVVIFKDEHATISDSYTKSLEMQKFLKAEGGAI